MSSHSSLEPGLPVAGIRLASAACGSRYQGRDDLALVEIADGSASAAIFTQNRFSAAPVVVARENLSKAQPRYLLFNAGNANAGTGDAGFAAVDRIHSELASLAGCSGAEILSFSTGVIGEVLDPVPIVNALTPLLDELSGDNWADAAAAIMTTDTVAKHCSVAVETSDGLSYRVAGMTKGSGMIHPNMATMLAFIGTDARVPQEFLPALVSAVADKSFNRITVDGDTSTNDALLVTATGCATPDVEIGPGHRDWPALVAAVEEVARHLAKEMIRDGEGATKFVQIAVSSNDEASSLAIANTVALSPLVKTAIFAGDPNWGRILMAIGRAPVDSLEVSQVSVYLGDYQIVEHGALVDGYREELAAAAMAGRDVEISIEVGAGASRVVVWTCDLSYDYVKINAEYRS